MKVFWLIFLSSISANSYCQLGSRNNFNTSPIQANPAATGVFNYGALNTNATITDSDHYLLDCSYQTHLPAGNSGVGVILGSVRFEAFSIFKTGLAYSYQTKLSETWVLSAGVSAFFHSERDDFFPEFDRKYFNFDGGILLYSKRFFLSFSTYQFPLSSEKLNLSLSSGCIIPISKYKGLSLSPVINLSLENEALLVNVRFNADYRNYRFVLGGGNNEFLTGAGLQGEEWGLHYIFSYIKTEFNNFFYIHNRISLQLKIPNVIERNSDSFNFQLF